MHRGSRPGHGARSQARSRRGGALVFATIAVAALTILGGAAWTLAAATSRSVNHARQDLRSFYLAEAGVSEGLAALATALAEDEDPPATIGTSAAPLVLNGGRYWVDIEEDAGDVFRVTASAEVNGARHGVEAVVRELADSIYAHALFAGNHSGDPLYSLRLSGTGASADLVAGDVYSGGDVTIEGEASVHGAVRATGSIHGGSGDVGVSQPIPDLAAMDYATNHDVDVAAAFAAGATYASNALGGSAWQLPEEHPAHIFRKDPSDRAESTALTEKSDYFLEDPYEPVRIDAEMDGSDACAITLAGQDGRPGPSGTGRVYYVDGNLWLHNRITFSFELAHGAAEEAVVTFVVRGNVYFSDNLFYQDVDHDAVVFIAVADPEVPDSGNIYFGDPVFGTLEQMHAFMYAENDFHDVNLDAAGSADVRVFGNMTAGNHVSIRRDYETGAGVAHSRLFVDFDPRIVEKQVEPPGLPITPGAATGLALVSWREVAAR